MVFWELFEENGKIKLHFLLCTLVVVSHPSVALVVMCYPIVTLVQRWKKMDEGDALRVLIYHSCAFFFLPRNF